MGVIFLTSVRGSACDVVTTCDVVTATLETAGSGEVIFSLELLLFERLSMDDFTVKCLFCKLCDRLGPNVEEL